jgi:hypothetical protein
MEDNFADWLARNSATYLGRWSAWMSFYRRNDFRWPDGMNMPVPQIYFDAEMNKTSADLVGYLQNCYERGQLPQLPPEPPANSETTYRHDVSTNSNESIGRAALRGAANGAAVGAGLGLLIYRLMRR